MGGGSQVDNLIALQDKLTILCPPHSGLLGCPRRAAWQMEEPNWRQARGNALLAYLGVAQVARIEGRFEYFYTTHRGGANILVYRGGPWSQTWVEDLTDLWAIAKVGCREWVAAGISDEVIVVHENKGDIHLTPVTVPQVDPDERVAALVAAAQADPPGRIPKSGERALRLCAHCPVRPACNALDRTHHDDLDWSPSYRQKLVP